ncbi:hypothetical protein M413DRAFT_437957 [Hebeloma cylindrosporum]|uniref:Elongin-A n=1 Tax=Hebeloma cylindrosporum TaxID=76867 RepID=A0A0C2YGC7_HEBCY|nr:hypothetical protein M413DRAFT_437957 [Hebeloma cylindrosporum h7]
MLSTDADQDIQQRRVPTLVQLCQRVAAAQVDSIHSLGNDLTYELVKPILDRCSIEQLLRFEKLSPHLRKDTPQIWKDLCYRKYFLTAEERYSPDDNPQEPDSWKSRYFVLQDAEARRIEELGSKLRTQRKEEIERKKGKEVKYTEGLPDAKRARTGSVQPKSLLQRTRTEASKIQRAYHTRVLPPMPTAKNYRIPPLTSGATLPSVPASVTASRVTVNTVVHRRPAAVPPTAASSSKPGPTVRNPASKPPQPADLQNRHSPHQTAPPTGENPLRPTGMTSVAATSTLTSASPARLPSKPLKKDPIACMFVPKRKNTQRVV